MEHGEETRMSIWGILARILLSALFGGIFYSIWLSVNLLLSPVEGLLEALLWIIAPLVTALGFASGLSVAQRFIKGDQAPFRQTVVWPLVGCVLGAVAVYWYGPMLIVFSMLALGTISVALREFLSLRKKSP